MWCIGVAHKVSELDKQRSEEAKILHSIQETRGRVRAERERERERVCVCVNGDIHYSADECR